MAWVILDSQTALAQFVQRRRKTLGFTQARLAIEAGVSRQWLVGVEHGRSGVALNLLLQLLHTLGCELRVSDAVVLRQQRSIALADDGRGDEREDATRAKQQREAGGGRTAEAPTRPRQARVGKDEPTADGKIKRDAGAYRVADLQAAGFSPDRERFYDKSYRRHLQSMVRHVIGVEGPILDDLLVRRIAEAHGFRAARKIRDIVRRAVDPEIKRTNDGKRAIYWPDSADPEKMPPFRNAAKGLRSYEDIPIAELASLAKTYLDKLMSKDETYKQMRQTLGLSRVGAKGQSKFLKAIALAQSSTSISSR